MMRGGSFRWSWLAALPLISSSAALASSPFSRVEPKLDDKSLARLVEQIGQGGQPARRASKELLGATPADAPLLHRELHRLTEVAAADYRNLLRSIGAHVPNHNGRFGPPPKKKVDWLEAVLTKKSRGPLAKAAVEARRSVALMRALAATRRSEAAVSLLRFAYRHQGAFRDECGRLLRQMGDYAVPGLVRAAALRDPLAFKMRRYAAYQLDRMNRARPELALRAADPQLRVDLLHAYGEVRATAAVAAVLSQVNAAVADVRRAARWAMLRYVSGRPPRAIKRHLKLAGGRQSDVQRSLYLTYRQLAQRALARTLAKSLAPDDEAKREQLVKRYTEEDDPRAVAARLFARGDRARVASQQKRYLAAQRYARAGETKRAIAVFDRLLLDDPYHPQASLMAPAYEAEALKLLAMGKQQRAVLMLTKALHLHAVAGASDGEAPQRRQARQRLRALRAVAEAARDRAAGLSDRWRLAEARSLAPDLPVVRQAVARSLERGRSTTLIAAAGAGGCLAAFCFGAWFWGRRRRARPANDATRAQQTGQEAE